MKQIGRRLLFVTVSALGCGSAEAAVTSTVAAGRVTVVSDADDAIVISCQAGNVRINDADPDGGATSCLSITQVLVTGGNQANTINLSAVAAAAFPNLPGTTVNANGGDDTIIGSLLADSINGGLGDDLIFSGTGDDSVIGGDGIDQVFLGLGNDTFSWNPGDDNDVVDGEGGVDTLRFAGANVAEIFSVSADGDHIRFARNVANVALDLDAVERIELSTFGGADTVSVRDTSVTDLRVLRVDLAEATNLAGADRIVVDGTDADDSFTLDATSDGVATTGNGRRVEAVNGDPVDDTLIINTLDGDDALIAQMDATVALGILFDGGAHGGPGDFAMVFGDASDETYTIAALGQDVQIERSQTDPARIDLAGVEHVDLAAMEGSDTFTTEFLPLTRLLLDGGDPTTFPGDSLVVNGFAGDIANPLLVRPGFAPIEHLRFELGILSADLDGRQVVSPTASPGRGRARARIAQTGESMSLALDFQGLLGVHTGTAIRGPAPRDATTTSVPLFTFAGSGSNSGSLSVASLPLTPEQFDQLNAGLLFIEIQSSAFPDGEIRGQLDSRIHINGFE